MKKIIKTDLIGQVSSGAVTGNKDPNRPFKEPDVQPPFVNLPQLLNVSGAFQIKQGGLSLGSSLKSEDAALLVLNGRVGIGTDKPKYSLDVSDTLNGKELCINGDCKSSWPLLQDASLEVRQCPLIDSGTACGGNTCIGQLTTENSCSAVSGGFQWQCPAPGVTADCSSPSLRLQCINGNLCVKKTTCNKQVRDCPIVGKLSE